MSNYSTIDQIQGFDEFGNLLATMEKNMNFSVSFLLKLNLFHSIIIIDSDGKRIKVK